jgi:hypothetical protein
LAWIRLTADDEESHHALRQRLGGERRDDRVAVSSGSG